MAKFNKQKIKIAADKNSKLDVSGTHVTTANFMQLQPIFYRHMLPGEHLKGSLSAFSRMAPVAVPTYGRCRLNLRSFFVPFSFVMPNFPEMVDDSVATNFDDSSLVAEAPKISTLTMFYVFQHYNYAGAYPLIEQVVAPAAYDFVISGDYYALTSYGRRFYKILVSLGYQLIPPSKGSFYLSALPLLCYAKIYLDYYANQAYANNADYLSVKRLFSFNDPTSTLELSAKDLFDILSICDVVNYDNGQSVYVNAWDTPVSPVVGNYSQQVMSDITADFVNDNYVKSNSIGTPVMYNEDVDYSLGTTYLHQVLKSMTDYFKRNQLSGALAVQRFLSRYGIQLDNKSIKRSYYISSKSLDIEFGSVMSNANTSSGVSNLGDYAGVGIGRGGLDIDFTAEEFGMFIVCLSIIPCADLFQGIDRNNFHIGKESFFIPEYDNLGCEAIKPCEVYVSRNSAFSSDASVYADNIYGFAPRYYEYKQGRSFVSGDFLCKSAMAGGNSWHLNREFQDGMFLSNIDNVVHSLNMTRGIDANQYNRIFQYTGSEYDKFYVVTHASLQAFCKCRSLIDSYDFDSVGKSIEQSGNSAITN